MSEKLKNLGQTAAELPQALKARIDQLTSASGDLNRIFNEDAYLKAEAQDRYKKIDEQIRSFNTDVELEFEQLHTLADKLLKRLDTAAEDVNEGARKVGVELDNLTAEVGNLDDLVRGEMPSVEASLQNVKREHDEMDVLSKKRLPILEETLTELEQKSQEGKKTADEFNNEAKSLYTKLQQESEKQKFRLEGEFGDWKDKVMLEVVELFVTNEIVEALKDADGRVLELLGELDTFFKDEVVEPSKEKAAGLDDKVQLLKQNVDNATSEAKESRSWIDPIIAQIEQYTGPLDALIAKAKELAQAFSPSGY